MYMPQPNTECKNRRTSKINCEEDNGLELAFFPATGDAQRHNGERITNGNGICVCIVIQVYIAIAILCSCCDFSILPYRSAKSKSSVTSNILK